MTQKRSFLLLQGPIGPFFKELGDDLRRRGHSVYKINFWGGDNAYYPNATQFTDPIAKWGSFFLKFCSDKRITDVVLFGDRRAYHEQAIERIALVNNTVRVWVLEEGYFRPHWVTLDAYGANYRSSLRVTGSAMDRIDTSNEPLLKIEPWIQEATPTILKYYTQGILTKPFTHNNYEYHRKDSPLVEGFNWAKKWAVDFLKTPDTEGPALVKSLAGQYFTATLQLEGDAQVRNYSKYESTAEFIEEVMTSFKYAASSDHHLLLKPHPYDENLSKRRSEVQKLSQELAITDRVHFIEECNFSELINNSIGVVTINSTSGLHALEHGKPVKIMGKCFWDISSITHSDELDTFWTNPQYPNTTKFSKLRDKIMSTQFNGSFYTYDGRLKLIPQISDQITQFTQNTEELSKEPAKREKNRRLRKKNRENMIISKKNLDMSV